MYRDGGCWAGWACRALGGTGAQAWALGPAGARAGLAGANRRERARGARQALGAGSRRRRARGAARQGARGAQAAGRQARTQQGVAGRGRRAAWPLGARASQGCALGALRLVFNPVFRLSIFPDSLNEHCSL